MKKRSRSGKRSPFAKNLQSLMAEKGLSQRALAKYAEVQPSVINDWIAGGSPANLEPVVKLCRALRVDFQYILTGISSGNEPKGGSISELFDIEEDIAFSGIYMIEAKRLKRKN